MVAVSSRIFVAGLVVLISTLPAGHGAYDPLQCYKHTKMKHTAVKEGCRPHVIYVAGCYGMCETVEVPKLGVPYKESNHFLCTYASYEYRSIELPDCDAGVDSTYEYINAVTCACSMPSTEDTAYYFRMDNRAKGR
ncbi:glycoprotein hormone beta-5-like [Ptychodera flava]|uniref:glycoprotein hormone beta-5-like n=1 Tax=Ptychodera flava TaxID=63121 RepID=UPI00396A9BF0